MHSLLTHGMRRAGRTNAQRKCEASAAQTSHSLRRASSWTIEMCPQTRLSRRLSLCTHGAQTAGCAPVLLCCSHRGAVAETSQLAFVTLRTRIIARARVESVCARVGAAPLGHKKLASRHVCGRARRTRVGEYSTNSSQHTL